MVRGIIEYNWHVLMWSKTVKYTAILSSTFVLSLVCISALNNYLLSSIEMAAISSSVDSVEVNELINAFQSPLLVEYECSLIGRDSLDALFRVTNISHDTVYFSVDENSKFQAYISNAYDLRQDTSAEIKNQILPGESTTLWVSVPVDSDPFDISIPYNRGDPSKSHATFESVAQQIKSYTCNAYSPR